MEIGPNDIKASQFVAIPRDTGEKIAITRDIAVPRIKELLAEMYKRLFNK